ncbi:hypothetical protein [Bacillus velezensis]|uniref:hypothetical protein n=2 Tax=Bacillus velezensis TaxID=492670 RepID=UPI00083DD964|nr:hypothetical protein [Bacillus velezensis]AZJ44165.1 hypothetical protein EG882_13125 [Bacillus velezensis]ODB65503.1 hypothetical protein A7313_14465 [Bacillus velezensis]
MKKWIKFDYDDGAEVFYNINNPDPNGEITIDFKVKHSEEDVKEFQLYDDELEQVYNQLQEMKKELK